MRRIVVLEWSAIGGGRTINVENRRIVSVKINLYRNLEVYLLFGENVKFHLTSNPAGWVIGVKEK